MLLGLTPCFSALLLISSAAADDRFEHVDVVDEQCKSNDFFDKFSLLVFFLCSFEVFVDKELRL